MPQRYRLYWIISPVSSVQFKKHTCHLYKHRTTTCTTSKHTFVPCGDRMSGTERTSLRRPRGTQSNQVILLNSLSFYILWRCAKCVWLSSLMKIPKSDIRIYFGFKSQLNYFGLSNQKYFVSLLLVKNLLNNCSSSLFRWLTCNNQYIKFAS